MKVNHAEAVLLYAWAFVGLANATTARMLNINADRMDLAVRQGDELTTVRAQFKQRLERAGDARRILIEMASTARADMTPKRGNV